MNGINEAITEIDVLTSAVADAMAEVTTVIRRDGIESEDAGMLRHLVEFVVEHTDGIRRQFMTALDSILVGWNEIIQNDMLQGKVREYLTLGTEFLTKADAFDVAVADCRHDLSALVGESWFARELLTVMCDWKRRAEPVLEYMTKNGGFEPRLADPFETAVRKLRKYFTGVGAEAFRGLVMNGVSLGGRPRWIRDRREGVIFGEMLGISCREMNLSFVFTNRDGTERPLKYSSDRPTLDYRCYDIYPILKELKDGIGVENKSHKKALNTAAL